MPTHLNSKGDRDPNLHGFPIELGCRARGHGESKLHPRDLLHTNTTRHGPWTCTFCLIRNGSRLVKTLRLRTAVCCVEGSLQQWQTVFFLDVGYVYSQLPVFGEKKWMLFVVGQSFIRWRDLALIKLEGSKFQTPTAIPKSHLQQAPVVTHPQFQNTPE